MALRKVRCLLVNRFGVAYASVFGMVVFFGADSMAMCNDGTVSSCIVNGKQGTRECVNGRWTSCMVEPTPAPTVVGTVYPKYYVLTVVYAPPGNASGKSNSSVEYATGSTAGTTVSSTASFKTDTKVSATASGGVLGGASVGASFGVIQTATDTSKLEIKKTSTTTVRDPGPSVDGIDHNRDIVYLLLNPKVLVSITGKDVSWTIGHSGDAADIQYAYVGWLKDTTTMPAGLAAKLASRGFTGADYQAVLRADPFASGATTIDNTRYLQTNTTIPYLPPYAAGEAGPTFTFALKNDLTSTQSQSSQSTTSVGMTLGAEANFPGVFKVVAKAENTWTWTNSSETSVSDLRSQTASVTMGTPSYGYSGPTDIAVYYDTLYRTFMFALIPVSTVMADGTVTSSTGQGVGSQDVILNAGGTRYRTYTNARGQYRFPGSYSGPMEIEIAGVGKRTVPANRRLDVVLPAATLPKSKIPVRNLQKL